MKGNLKRILKRESGFTLVEVIVVLVILSILGTMLLPPLTKHIDNTNERAAVAEARSAVIAAQTLVSERYAGISGADPTAVNIKDLAEVGGTVAFTYSSDTSEGKVTKLVYSYNGGTKTVTYEDGAYKVK